MFKRSSLFILFTFLFVFGAFLTGKKFSVFNFGNRGSLKTNISVPGVLALAGTKEKFPIFCRKLKVEPPAEYS